MTQQAMSQQTSITADGGTWALIGAQWPRAVAWGAFALVLSLGGSLLHDGAVGQADIAGDGVLFWSFVVMSLTVEPLVSTAFIALVTILLTRARVDRFAALLATAAIVALISSFFDRAAAIALFGPVLVFGHLFVARNEGRDDYAQGFVVAWLAQCAFNLFAIVGLVVVRASA